MASLTRIHAHRVQPIVEERTVKCSRCSCPGVTYRCEFYLRGCTFANCTKCFENYHWRHPRLFHHSGHSHPVHISPYEKNFNKWHCNLLGAHGKSLPVCQKKTADKSIINAARFTCSQPQCDWDICEACLANGGTVHREHPHVLVECSVNVNLWKCDVCGRLQNHVDRSFRCVSRCDFDMCAACFHHTTGAPSRRLSRASDVKQLRVPTVVNIFGRAARRRALIIGIKCEQREGL